MMQAGNELKQIRHSKNFVYGFSILPRYKNVSARSSHPIDTSRHAPAHFDVKSSLQTGPALCIVLTVPDGNFSSNPTRVCLLAATGNVIMLEPATHRVE
jgi:hypothetical protein